MSLYSESVKTETQNKSVETIVSRILTFLSQDWTILFTIGYQLYLFLAKERSTSTYEILEYDTQLELLDSRGELAKLQRHQRVKFLQDNVIAFQDHAWGEGEIFADYKVTPGAEVDRYKDGDRWNVLISLRETKGKGDIEDFYINRTIRDGFTEDSEWWQVEVWYRTKFLKLSAIFPADRTYKRVVLHTRSNNKTEVLDNEHFHALPDGRQMVTWEKENPRQSEVYTLKWDW